MREAVPKLRFVEDRGGTWCTTTTSYYHNSPFVSRFYRTVLFLHLLALRPKGRLLFPLLSDCQLKVYPAWRADGGREEGGNGRDGDLERGV